NIVPPTLREASVALGASFPTTVFRVLLPNAFGGVFTGILLAISRVIGETAPLMFTALGCATIRWDMTKPMSAVPLMIWEFWTDANLQNLVWSAALFLLLLVLTLNFLAKYIERKFTV
ncbi:MAG: ABC transporter permease subunit, partial [Marinilabiliaceae bacterium]|nr:ABC transporter permease subunit [Marinilabiliaceae bacterium]